LISLVGDKSATGKGAGNATFVVGVDEHPVIGVDVHPVVVGIDVHPVFTIALTTKTALINQSP
jgi:hypothetical protein